MVNRALFRIKPNQVTTEVLAYYCQLSHKYEEAIFVLSHADIIYNSNLKSGELIVFIQSYLASHCPIPYFLLPFSGSDTSSIHYWIQLKLLTPSFETLHSQDLEDENFVKMVLGCSYKEVPQFPSSGIQLPQDKKSRGLFITRAQPFHNGHAAFIRQMADECDEAIVLIAAAEQSHLPANPLSATERLEMLHAFLQKELKNRYYLFALPQNNFTLENMMELNFLLPSFQWVYSTNPVIASMCQYLSIPVRSLKEKISLSATEARAKILANEDIESLVPPEIHGFLKRLNFRERLQLLNREDKR